MIIRVAGALLLQLYLLYQIAPCTSAEGYSLVAVPNNQFCRRHTFNTISAIGCAAQCQLKENNAICTAYTFDAQRPGSCECGQAPCFDSSYATDPNPKPVLVNVKCHRFQNGKTCGKMEKLRDISFQSTHDYLISIVRYKVMLNCFASKKWGHLMSCLLYTSPSPRD